MREILAQSRNIYPVACVHCDIILVEIQNSVLTFEFAFQQPSSSQGGSLNKPSPPKRLQEMVKTVNLVSYRHIIHSICCG